MIINERHAYIPVPNLAGSTQALFLQFLLNVFALNSKGTKLPDAPSAVWFWRLDVALFAWRHIRGCSELC